MSAPGSCTSTSAVPLPCPKATASESASRFSTPGRTTSRSTSTSIVWRVRRASAMSSAELALLAVDADAHEAAPPELVELLLVLALQVAHDGRVEVESCVRGERHQAVDDLLHRLGRDLPLADVAERLGRHARTAAAGSRISRSPCRRSSAGSARCPSARWRSPERVPRSRRSRASSSARGTAARRLTATRHSAAGPRHRACRRRASTCRTPRDP